MADEIVTREFIRNKAIAAFIAGRPRDSHGMNPSDARTTWLHAYDALANSTLTLQNTDAVAKRVDAAQVEL